MPKYSRTVTVPGKSAQEIYDKVAADIERFLSKTPLGKYEIERDAAKKEVRFKASMASASLFCQEGQLQLDANLSMMAMPFRSKLDEGIDRWIAKVFSATPGGPAGNA